ncbi:hypothetical protein [uncultured Devosia sp.]|uniref:hypothetical protein n=1 Tax=uncultured Devosia sp. TaxID=211434 RepID=UPI0035C9A2CE
MTLEQHFALIAAEQRRSVLAPLSLRKTMLVAVLLDHFADRVFEQARASMPDVLLGAEDVLAWRAVLAERSAALAQVFAIGSGKAVLRVETVTVPIVDYPGLTVEDFMVSLYNDNSVQRVMIVEPDGTMHMAHDCLRQAVAYWEDAGWRTLERR